MPNKTQGKWNGRLPGMLALRFLWRVIAEGRVQPFGIVEFVNIFRNRLLQFLQRGTF
jgi:hypothetical protein